MAKILFQYLLVLNCLSQILSDVCFPLDTALYASNNFNQWSDLNRLVSEWSEAKEFCDLNVTQINVKPKRQIPLIDELNIMSLADYVFFGTRDLGYDLTIDMSHLAGLEVYINRTKQETSIYTLKIEASVVYFSYNKNRMDENEGEQLSIHGKVNTTFLSLFNSFKSIVFGQKNKYEDCVCPLIFNNSNLSSIFLTGIVDSLVKNNIWQFCNVSNEFVNFNSAISVLSLVGFNYILDQKLLNSFVFKSTSSIGIHASVHSIQIDMFKSLAFLNDLRVHMDSLKNFFHNVGLSRTRYVNFAHMTNYTVVINSSSVTAIRLTDNFFGDVQHFISNNYLYPDEDFWLF
jgi:hypothetical protein